MSQLKIKSNNGFLQMEDLPQNCIFNKVVTGCGGTTIALFNNKNQIITTPTTELITNKTGLTKAGVALLTSPDQIKTQSAFALFGTFKPIVKKELETYLSTEGCKKILCTYDKISSLMKLIEPQEYQILIDEYHQLLKACSYRTRAVNGVLQNFKRFKSFCFLSATPISPDFAPSALLGIEQVDAVWENEDRLIVALEQTNKPYVKVANIINNYKTNGYIDVEGKRSYEAFFFLNSVTDIVSILKHCHLTNDEIKIICADTEKNREKLEGYTISNSRTPNKKFTFITSKSFEGVDYFSETGLCFVVSNSQNKNTLLDISTDIYQIAGRIRNANNPFKNKLVHIFNTAGKRKLHLDITYEEYEHKIREVIKGGQAIIDSINSDEQTKRAAQKMLKDEYWMQDESGNYVLNDILIKLELMNYKIEEQIYKTGIQLQRSYHENGILSTEINYDSLQETVKKTGKKLSFKEAFLKYVEVKHSFDFGEQAKEIKEQYPLVASAYDKLGEKRVRELRYVQKTIEKELLLLDNTRTQQEKVAKEMVKEIATPTTKTCDELIRCIAEVYEKVGINQKIKASHIEKWFECKKSTKRINGKATAIYKIFTPKLIRNEE